MLKKKVQEALNDQLNLEFESAYIYLAMSAYCDSKDWHGMASWFREQSSEERVHAMKIYDFVQDLAGTVVLKAISKPSINFGKPLDCFQKALEHEQLVTKAIHNLYELCMDEKDYPTQVMLQWFIQEQVEEEKTATDLVSQLNQIGNDTGAFVRFDAHLMRRGAGAEAGI